MSKLTVDIHGAAEMMNVHHQTVRDRINDCELRAAKIGSAYVIRVSDVMELIEREIVAQTAERMKKRPAKKLPQKIRQIRPAQVGVTQQHAA